MKTKKCGICKKDIIGGELYLRFLNKVTHGKCKKQYLEKKYDIIIEKV